MEAEKLIGRTISHYKILEKIGEGGMGIVYKAQDTFLYRNVAIKSLPSSLNQKPEFIQRFIQEGRTASSLNHPNICTIHDVIEDNNQYYIVMEYVDGKSLREILDEGGPLTQDKVIEIGIGICDGLKTAHSNHIIHRDIKPENIMITNDGVVKIMDFGLAKLKLGEEYHKNDVESKNITEQDADLYKTSLSNILGTVSYMAPEQIEKKPIDQRTDLFSVGVVLYELLSGKNPFTGNSKIEIMESILENDPTSLKKLNTNINFQLDKIVLKTINKNPIERYQNVESLNNALNQLIINEREDKIRIKKSRVSQIIILLLVVTIVLINYFFFNPFKKSLPPWLAQDALHELVTSETGIENGKISPEGNYLAYIDGFGTAKIKDMITGVVRPIAESINGFSRQLAWSPNNSQIAIAKWQSIENFILICNPINDNETSEK